MHPIVVAKREEVAALCRRLGVERLELFGSAARDDFDVKRSDLDFIVRLPSDARRSPLDSYFDLKDALESMFGRPVDLVCEGSVRNPYVLRSIQRDRQRVYPA